MTTNQFELESTIFNVQGALDPDFLAIGLGGTSMMAMLWSVAMGRRVVGVEMRGDPFLGVHWNVREDFYHQLGLIDQMMLDRYGKAGVPQRSDGRTFSLAECFYSTETKAGDIVPDNVIDGFDDEQHIAGTIHHVEFIDDRWKDGVPGRILTLLRAPEPPSVPDPAKIRTNVVEVLDGPSTFQASAASILILLRRYLEAIERMDVESGLEHPRVRMFTRHRVVPSDDDGFVRDADGRLQIRIEALQEFDHKGKFVRVRRPGSQVIDLGVPELFMIAEGVRSSDAARLGFEQKPVTVDHGDGRGAVVAQADFLAGLIEVLVDGRLRRRISSSFDEEGREYWIRQIAVGHENDPEVGWVLVQVPDHLTFDPVKAGLVGEQTDPESPEYFAAYQVLVHDYYLEQCSEVLEIPKRELKRYQMVYGPKLFSLIEQVGDDARVAPNGVVAGDSFGNGHFLTSGGAMTGMVAHSARVLQYWRERDAGVSAEQAIVALADGIKADTHGWLEVSAKEYSQALPINFGAERTRDLARLGGIDEGARAHAVDASRRTRHALLPLDPSDWRRLFLRNGKVRSAPLPDLHPMHPALRVHSASKPGEKVAIAFVARSFDKDALEAIRALLRQPGVRLGVIHEAGATGLPEKERVRLAGCVAVADCNDALQICRAVNELSGPLGRPDRLLSTRDDLQVPLGQAREALALPGPTADAARNFDVPSRTRELLTRAGLPVLGEGEAVTNPHSLEVMSLHGVPAWFSATRTTLRNEASSDGRPLVDRIVLPRELDDPADLVVRRMAFAALKSLGMDSGLSHIRWYRRADGTTAFAKVSATPPTHPILALMGHAHGADMVQVWAKSAVRGLFTPIPRQHAAGLVYLHGVGEGERVTSVDGWETVQRELGESIAASRLPDIGSACRRGATGEGFVVIKHAQTKHVEQALDLITQVMKVSCS